MLRKIIDHFEVQNGRKRLNVLIVLAHLVVRTILVRVPGRDTLRSALVRECGF